MRYNPDLRDSLLARARKARCGNKASNAYLRGFLKAYADIEALAQAADPADPDRLAAAVLERFAACQPDLKNRTDLKAAGHAGAWQDAAHGVACYDPKALAALLREEGLTPAADGADGGPTP